MAGFNDIAQALQFGAGLVHGFQKQTDEIRAAHDKQQLELLKLLSSDETKNVTPIDPDEVVNTSGFFGGGTLKTKEGHPAFKVGGNIFAVRPRPMLGGDDTAPTTPSVPTSAAPSVTPLAPLQQFGPTPTAPETPAAPAAPAAQPGLETSAPSGSKAVVGAIKSHAALAPDMKSRIYKAVDAEVAKHPDVSRDEVLGIIGVESQFNPGIVSPKGAVGLMQLMPATAAGLKVADSTNIEENIRGGVEYYAKLKKQFGGSQEMALAAYNAGPDRVAKLGRVPNFPETKAYIQAVPAAAAAFRGPNVPAGTVASVGKTAAPATPPGQITAALQPPTAPSTPAQPAAPAQPDTSMMVAGPGAPGPKTPAPAQSDTSAQVAGPGAPSESTLPPADTVAQRQADATARVTKQYKGAQTPKEMHEFRQARKEAQDKAETHYGQELREVEKDVKELRSRTHDPRVLDLLDEVKTLNQFEHVKKIVKATPEQDFMGQATDYLAGAVKAGKGDEAAVTVWKQLKRANYSEAEIKETLRIAGYDDAKSIEKAGKIAKQQKEVDIAAIPKEQAAKLPGIMEQKKAEQELEISGIPKKLAAEAPGLQKRKEQEAGIITPEPKDIPAVNAEMQNDIKRGKVAKDITMSDYLKQFPSVLTTITEERKASENMESPVGKLQADRARLVKAGGADNAAAIQAIDEQLTRLGESPEEQASRAAIKTGAVNEAAAAAKSQRIGTAQDDVNKILSGETPTPAGMDKHTAAVQRLRKDNLQPSDISPQFANELEEHKDFKRLEDRKGWFAPDYTEPSVANIADSKDKGAVHLAKEETPRFRLGNELHTKLQRIDDNMVKLAEIDPRWKALSEGRGMTNRMKLNYYQALHKITQDNPTTSAFMRAIDNDMKEIGINYGRFITGMQGRPAQKLIELSTQNLPNADTSVVSWITGKGKIPDNPATMLTQLGLMKDMIRTVQDDTLMESGGITPAEKEKRAAKRLDDLAHPERAKQAAAAPVATTPTAAAPVTPTAAAPAPAKSKGQQEADDYLSGGKP